MKTIRTLHILKNPNALEAVSLIQQKAAVSKEGLAILLIQEAVRMTPPIPVPIYALEEDARALGVSPSYEKVNYKEMLEMILNADTVMVW